MKTISACILFAVLPCQATRADLIPISLPGNAEDWGIHEVTNGSFTVDGLTVTLSATGGQLYGNSSQFGVNAEGSSDGPALLDGGSGTSEAITITFDQPIELLQMTLTAYAHNGTVPELAKLQIGLNSQQDLEPTPQAADVYDFTNANFLPVGQSAIIRHVSGNGFSLAGIQVNTVPEPTTFTLSALAMVGLMLKRRNRTLCTQ